MFLVCNPTSNAWNNIGFLYNNITDSNMLNTLFIMNNLFQETQFSEYLPELRVHLEGRAMTPDLFKEEESMCQDFNVKKNWREG